ncbi:MAG: hypothetical protein JXQ84_10200 [Rhodospirillaceae bacterium]|nr:hypothetical protein [Rhodospirillaceae bacterium]
MKRVLIIVVVALLLSAGVGVGVYVFAPSLLGVEKTADAAPEPPPSVVEAPKKPSLVHMATIDVPIVSDGVIDRQVHFTVLLITAPESQVTVQDGLPRLRNAFIQFAYAAFPQQFEKGGHMELPRLKVSLKQIAQRLFGGDVIHDVLIQSYFEM